MHPRRLASFLLGVWFGCALLSAWTAAANLLHADRLTASVRLLLANWGAAQIGLAAVLFLFLLFGTGEGKRPLILATALLSLTFLQRLLITPTMASGGGMPDPALLATPAGAQAPEWLFLALELGKWGVAAVLGFKLMRRRARSGNARNEFDMVDHADNRRVDG
jgi:hypothetical protein